MNPHTQTREPELQQEEGCTPCTHSHTIRKGAVTCLAASACALIAPVQAAPRGYLRLVELDVPTVTYVQAYRQDAPHQGLASVAGWYAGAVEGPEQRQRELETRRQLNHWRTALQNDTSEGRCS